ncbi:MAG: hypothetical protein J0I17_11170 ['Candidatus Kapabacteria' thiocyanatum]|nr:hypothetical protein ['Candidatus Kapabacteria' thiocyanatum]
MIIQYLADGPQLPRAMDNRYAFTPIPGLGAAAKPCRNCGRGDVNVNVNVNTGSNASVGSSRQHSESAPPDTMPPVVQHVERETPKQQDVPDVRRILREELTRSGLGKPSFEGPQRPPTAKRQVEYRPVFIPRDRIVERVQYKPFNVVWDRLRRVFTNRDVMHPVDRVRTVPAAAVRPSFEGTARR